MPSKFHKSEKPKKNHNKIIFKSKNKHNINENNEIQIYGKKMNERAERKRHEERKC